MAIATAFNPTRYSVFSLRPAAWTGEGEAQWEHWDKWAMRNGILDKHGQPSLKKVKYLIRHHCLAATVRKTCIPSTFHSYHPITNKPIYRNQTRIVVYARFPDQLSWTPEQWQECYRVLFSRSQSWKRKGKGNKRKK